MAVAFDQTYNIEGHIGAGRVNLLTDTFKAVLSNTAINLATVDQLADIVRFDGAQFRRDIGSRETLAELAGEAGMDPERVRRFLEGHEGAEDVRRDEAIAQRAGITGVPAFIAAQLAGTLAAIAVARWLWPADRHPN